MFIRPIGRNQLQQISHEEYVPDITFETEQDFILYIIQEPIVKFLKSTHFGFKMSEENGFLTSKKVKINNKEFSSNVIFVLDNDFKQIKETHSADFVKLLPTNIVDNIKNIREKSIPTSNNDSVKNKI